MKKKQDIITKDSKGRWHGYQEWYGNGKLWMRGTYKHDQRIGYIENHHVFKYTTFYIR